VQKRDPFELAEIQEVSTLNREALCQLLKNKPYPQDVFMDYVNQCINL